MNNICFATGNKGKIATLEKYFRDHGVEINVEGVSLDLTEPQAENATQVAVSKARQAYEILGRPVVADDSSFHITALGGFPGPYIKYMLSTIGIDGILRFLEKQDDRTAYFLSSLVYIDEEGKEHIFEDDPYWGTISTKIVEVDKDDSWSDLYKVFVPKGVNKTLVELTDAERIALKTKGDSYTAFSKWIKG